ncbi:MAG: hypothetical protein J7K75_08680 [Desulfuromonas sp.]|nr:hypothetical protein [Desulfuromonas sp.]
MDHEKRPELSGLFFSNPMCAEGVARGVTLVAHVGWFDREKHQKHLTTIEAGFYSDNTFINRNSDS